MKNKIFFSFTFILILSLLISIPGFAQNRGGDITLGIGTDPESLDPIEASSSPAAMVMLHVTEPLFDMTPEGEIEPLLAEDYEASEDGTEWTIKLKEDIEFHDGTSFNAEAVKFNLERLLDPDNEAPFRFLIDKISEIEVEDEYTVKITTEEPFAPIINHLSHDFVSMVSPQAAEEYDDELGENPVGTGPFVFEEWTRGEEVTLTRNDDYWGEGPYLDEVIFEIVPEDSTRVVMLETGEADAIMRVPPNDVERLDENSELYVEQVSSLRTIYLGFNNKEEPFDDKKVRQAFNYAVNKESIVNNILQGAGKVSDAPITSEIFGHSGQEVYEYNPEKAEELLAEAGYEDGLSVTLYHPVGRYLMDETIAQAVQSQLSEVGVDVELKTMEWTTYLETLQQPPEDAEHKFYMMGWGCVTGDADYGLYPMFHSSQIPPEGWELSYLENDEVDDSLNEARVNPDEETRLEYYDQAIEKIWDEAPWLFLHSELQLNGVREGVKGLIHHPREYISVKEAYIEE